MKERLPNLRRLFHPTTWRFMLMMVTDPRWEPLFSSITKTSAAARFKDPRPWFAWHSMEDLQFEVAKRRGGKVFEWGSGASTLWYEKNGLSVTAFEHDPKWFNVCSRQASGATDVRLVPLGPEYEAPKIDFADYTIIVIDGRSRVACAETVANAIEAGHVKPDSLVIFDDSNRPWYKPALERLEKLCRAHRSYSGTTSFEIDKLTTFFWV